MPHGNETRLYGDSAYIDQKEILNQLAPKAKDFTNCSTTRIRQHYSCTTQVLVRRFHGYISQKALAVLPPHLWDCHAGKTPGCFGVQTLLAVIMKVPHEPRKSSKRP